MAVLTTAQAIGLKSNINKTIGYLDDAVGNYGEKAGNNPDNLPTLGMHAARAQGQREVLSEVQRTLVDMLYEHYLPDEAILLRVAIASATMSVTGALKEAQTEGRFNGLRELVRLIDQAKGVEQDRGRTEEYQK